MVKGGTHQKIMCATYEALCKHGYADLTIKKIAEEFDKGKSVIYYHFDDKDDLMLAFLDDLKDEISEMLEPEENANLEEFFRMILAIEDEEMWEFRKALFEMKSQAPYSSEFSEKFEEIHQFMEDYLRSVFEQEDFENPDKQAKLVLYTLEGAMDRAISEQDKEELEKVSDWILEEFELKQD